MNDYLTAIAYRWLYDEECVACMHNTKLKWNVATLQKKIFASHFQVLNFPIIIIRNPSVTAQRSVNSLCTGELSNLQNLYEISSFLSGEEEHIYFCEKVLDGMHASYSPYEHICRQVVYVALCMIETSFNVVFFVGCAVYMQ